MKNFIDSICTNDIDTIQSEIVKSHYEKPTGNHFIVEIDGVAHEYFHEGENIRSMHLAKKLESEIDVVEAYTSHAPSIGSHYEAILRNLVADFLPNNYEVASGFVFNNMSKKCSPQTDIIVFKTSEFAPIYRRAEFSIVDSSQVLACCEVKKQLTSKELRLWLRKVLRFNWRIGVRNSNFAKEIALFAFKSKLKTEKILNIVVEEFSSYLEEFEVRTIDDKIARMALTYVTLPQIILFDRPEFISCSLAPLKDSTDTAFIVISVLSNFGANGIPALLSYLNPVNIKDPSYRDFISSLLLINYKSHVINKPVKLVAYISSAEILKIFPNSNYMLQKSNIDGQVIIGAYYNPFYNLESFNSLDELSKSVGFKWNYYTPIEEVSRHEYCKHTNINVATIIGMVDDQS